MFPALVLLCLVGGSLAAKFPTEVQKCKFEDSACFVQTANGILEMFTATGLPGLNLPPMDPLKIEKMDIVQGGESPINVVLNFKKVDLIGLKDAKFTNLKGFTKEGDNDKIELTVKAPVLSLVGGYKISGRVLVLPIQGDGKSNMTMVDIVINAKFTTKKFTKNNKEYIQVDKFKMNFDTSRFYMSFSNLFNGDKALGDNMNLFLNDNWQDILNELKPAITDAFSQIFQNVINSGISKVPHKNMFLE